MKNFIIGLVVLCIGFAIYWFYIGQNGFNGGPNGDRGMMPQPHRSAKTVSECVAFSGGGSMSLTRGENGCVINLETVGFFKNSKCQGNGKPGQVKKDIGDVVCSGLFGGCAECVLETHNTPYFIELIVNGEAVKYCYDWDGGTQDCNLASGATCIDSAQCLSGNCSGGTCQ